MQQQRRTLPSQASRFRREVFAATKAHFAVSSESFPARSVCSNKGALCRLKRVVSGEKCLQQQRRTLPSQASRFRREVFAATKAHFAVSSESFPARSVCSYKGALCRLKRVVCGEKCLQQQRRTLPSQAIFFAARNFCSNKGALCRLKRVLSGEKCLQLQRRTLPSQASRLRREVFAATKAHFAVSSELFAARSVCSQKAGNVTATGEIKISSKREQNACCTYLPPSQGIQLY